MLFRSGDISEGHGVGLAAAYSSKVTDCSETEMWEILGDGFEGMVLVTDKMAGDLDLARLCELPQVQVLLLPGDSSGPRT